MSAIPRARQAFVRLAVMLVLAFGAVATLATLLQERLLFPGAYGLPDVPEARDEAAASARMTQRALRTEDGHSVLSWHRQAGFDRVVLYVGGNFEPIEASVPLADLLEANGWELFAVAPRGWPGSEGTPGEAAFEADMRAAWAYLTGPLRIPPSRIVLHGRSLGGGIVGLLMADTRPAGVVLESTFDSIVPLAQERYPWLPVGLLLRHRFDTALRAHRVKAPVFVTHSQDDDIIPVERATRLAAAFPRSEFHVAEGLGHNQRILVADPTVQRAWSDFLERAAPRHDVGVYIETAP